MQNSAPLRDVGLESSSSVLSLCSQSPFIDFSTPTIRHEEYFHSDTRNVAMVRLQSQNENRIGSKNKLLTVQMKLIQDKWKTYLSYIKMTKHTQI